MVDLATQRAETRGIPPNPQHQATVSGDANLQSVLAFARSKVGRVPQSPWRDALHSFVGALSQNAGNILAEQRANNEEERKFWRNKTYEALKPSAQNLKEELSRKVYLYKSQKQHTPQEEAQYKADVEMGGLLGLWKQKGEEKPTSPTQQLAQQKADIRQKVTTPQLVYPGPGKDIDVSPESVQEQFDVAGVTGKETFTPGISDLSEAERQVSGLKLPKESKDLGLSGVALFTLFTMENKFLRPIEVQGLALPADDPRQVARENRLRTVQAEIKRRKAQDSGSPTGEKDPAIVRDIEEQRRLGKPDSQIAQWLIEADINPEIYGVK